MNRVFDRLDFLSLLDPAARTSTANGSSVQVNTYDGQAIVVLQSAAGSGTNPTLDVKIQDSPDGSTDWQDVSGATFTQVTDAAAVAEKIKLSIGSVRKHIRAVATIGGTSPSFTCSVAILPRAKYLT